ncbi:hypothetical protein ACORG1_00345 [Mycobacterium sp. TJFP1]
MTDPPAERASEMSDDDLRRRSAADARYIHGLTIKDLDRAAAAAVDLDDPDVIDGAWR